MWRPNRAGILKIVILNAICILLLGSLLGNHVYFNGGEIPAPKETDSKSDGPHTVRQMDNQTYGIVKHEDEREQVKRDMKKMAVDDEYNSFGIREKRKILVDTNVEYTRRLSQAYDQCLGRTPGMAKRVMVDRANASAICIVPKVGCTYWINIFRFINNETGGVVYNKPADIPRMVTHYGYINKSRSYRLLPKVRNDRNYFKRISFLDEAFRFMFVRHPIRRLWSAWVDKFLLPDFWFTEGPFIVKDLNLSAKYYDCPTDITFHQFLRYVTGPEFRQWPGDLNEHWAPIENLCDPCVFHPHLIGKMETFGEDSEVAMSIMNAKSQIREIRKEVKHHGNNTSTHQESHSQPTNEADGIWLSTPYHGDRAVHEMKMLTSYNIMLMNTQKFKYHNKGCRVSKLIISKRLWKTFQYNGHIPSEIGFPMKSWNTYDWHRALLRAYRSWNSDKRTREKQQRSQREKVFRTVYERIPGNVLLEIHKMYKNDFLQFGYEFEP